MTKPNIANLGKLQSAHGIAPAFLQRAAIVAIVSFVFFLAMLYAFSLRQNIGYFLLATAFLIVQLFTLSGWIMQKRTEFKIYENGFAYKKHVCKWNDIEAINISKKSDFEIKSCEIKTKKGEKIVLSEAIHGVGAIARRIQHEIAERK